MNRRAFLRSLPAIAGLFGLKPKVAESLVSHKSFASLGSMVMLENVSGDGGFIIPKELVAVFLEAKSLSLKAPVAKELLESIP
jgi:hypothetical protein